MRLIVKLLPVLFISLSITTYAQVQIGSDLVGETVNDYFGKQVKISNDGNILGVISAGSNGNVHVYQNVGDNWVLYGTDSEGNHFDGLDASGINFSNNGNTLAIGGEEKAWVYTYESGIWTLKGSEILNNTSDLSFGKGVCLSEDGNIIAVSTPTYVPPSMRRGNIPPPNYHGMVQVFKFESGSWNQIGDDIIANAFDRSAESFSLSADGNIVAIANYFSIRVYENISGDWTMKGSEIIGIDNYSKSVSLSSDGTTLAFGDPSYSKRGQVRIYKFISNNWVQVGGDILGISNWDFAGNSVSISSDGNVVAISFTGDDTNGDDSGQVKIYSYISGSWTQIGSSLNGEASLDRFGYSLNLSSDATALAVGTPYNDSSGDDYGKVEVYELSSLLSSDDKLDLSDFRLFPNPAKNEFTIQIKEGLELQRVNIYNSLGQLLYIFNKNTINISEFSRGIYYAEIITDRGKSTRKLVAN
ncbi:T9SS type A sorting domain-containing protein [Yeosuana sp. MJ-SS3]|uniref:T9SS type A sorting domain-containing protein n=1 Tax=Gilvirhabdus luticola TaxID=3079858 RepID=A0ABU3U7N0_9FLAO|nr:T9SS type A sorting domain-containing protein [Yeosuana sp. MJ-SS3]MDU8886332.1 T9SS type A sorting domain-containing protein [Yeosuana sp. MJ-SS3]